MDNWDYWNREEARQDPPPDSSSQQGASNEDYLRRQLLVHQLQQNFDDSQQRPLYFHSEPSTAPATMNDYQYQARPDERNYALGTNLTLHSHGRLQPYSQAPPQNIMPSASQIYGSIGVDALGADESVATRQNVWSNQYGVGTASTQPVLDDFQNRSAGHHQKRERYDGEYDMQDHMAGRGQNDGEIAPAQKRMKPDEVDNSILAMILGRQPSPTPTPPERPLQDDTAEAYPSDTKLPPSSDFGSDSNVGEPSQSDRFRTFGSAASETNMATESLRELGGNQPHNNMNVLIDGMFGDTTSREAFATEAGGTDAYNSAVNSDVSAVEIDGRTEEMNIDGGIFDDADDDVDLPATFKYASTSSFAPPRAMTAPNEPQNVGQSMPPPFKQATEPSNEPKDSRQVEIRPSDADEETFSDAVNDPTADAVKAAASGKKAKPEPDPKSKKPKKDRAKPTLSKPIALPSQKEKKAATALLKDVTDLTLVLPENACRFLAEEFWIFTVQQFEHVYDSSSASYDTPSMRTLRDEIREKVAISISQPKSGDDLNPSRRGLEPTELERLLFVPSAAPSRTGPPSESTQQDVDVATGSSLSEKLDDGAERSQSHEGLTEIAKRLPEGDPTITEVDVAVPDTAMKNAQPDLSTFMLDLEGSIDVPPAMQTDTVSDAQVVDSIESTGNNTSSAKPASDVSSTVVAVDGTNDVAEKILDSWIGRLEDWKRNPARVEKVSIEEMKSSFSLKGPLGLLFPEILHNFLASISVSTAFEFLSVRFTEAALAMQALIVWRQLCELEGVKGENLAKYMGGIASRVRTALSSVPPADAHTRKWMGSSLACLTAASKEFLIDECKLETPEEFLNGRTSDFSEKLVAWRAKKQKSVLKGSGRVAMISSFKAFVRDSMAAEDTKNGTGRETSEDEIIELSRKLFPVDNTKDDSSGNIESKAQAAKTKNHKELFKLTESQRLKAETVLKSADFLKDVLMPDNIEFLSTQNISTPEQLLNTDKQAESTLIDALVKWKTEKTGREAKATSCRRLLFDWSSKVKERVKQVATGVQAKETATKAAPKPPPARKPDASSSPKRTRPRYPKNISDPIQALSPTALAFLNSIGVTTGDKFLSTRTSEMATALAEWREREKKVALKGTGCSATVSGWKASVRKAKEYLEGEDQVAASDDESPQAPASRPPRRTSLPPKPKIDDVIHPSLLDGLPRRNFLVQNVQDSRFVYEFELSVRKPGNDFVVCLTYRGAKEILRSGKTGQGDDAGPTSDPTSVENGGSEFLPVLQDATGASPATRELTNTFVASRPGCGLIDVGTYGAIPLPLEGEDQPGIPTMIERFLRNEDCPTNEAKEQPPNSPLDTSACNVLVRLSPEKGTQCLFYAADPIEKGQTLELRFSQRIDYPSRESIAEPFVPILNRLSLARKISSMSLDELSGIVEQASKILDSVKGNVDHKEAVQVEQKVCIHPQMLRRRVHWLASNVLRYLEESREGSDADRRTRKALTEAAEKLLMTTSESAKLFSYAKQSGEESELVLGEFSEEILCDAVLSNSTREWLESGSWCEVSTALLNKCLRTASVHLLSCMEGNEQQGTAVNDIEECVFEAVKQVISWDRDLHQLAFQAIAGENASLSRESFLGNYDRLPKGLVAKATTQEAYDNAMDLCDEIAYNDSVNHELYSGTEGSVAVIAAKVPWNQDTTIMRSLKDVENENALIDVRWYIENEILAVAYAIASSRPLQFACAATTSEDTTPDCSYARFAAVARRILEADPTDDRRPSLEQPSASTERLMNLEPILSEQEGTSTNAAAPDTLPLFLAVVWPRLKSGYGFCIEVGDDPNEVIFFPPGHKGHLQLASERQLGKQRLERSRKRLKVQQRVNEVGFGVIPKSTKRMFISAARDDVEHETGTPVKDALKQFVSSVLSELPERDDAECQGRLTAIEHAVKECFDALVPSMLPEGDGGSESTPDLEVAHLMQVLLILPSLLEQSGLSMRKIEDTLGVIRDLAEFMTFKNKELFAEGVQLCREEYESGYDVARPFLLPRMQDIATKSSAIASGDSNDDKKQPERDPNYIREIINPEDMGELSGFICTVLSQFLPCRADAIDASKRRGIHVGYPGMMCRHCAGKGTEGRYYFTSLDSLNTAATATLGHLYKCQHVPDDLKKKIADLKTRHGDERKALKHGAQARFFSRLWKRLWSTDGIAPPVVLANHRAIREEEVELVTPTAASSSRQNDQAHEMEFKSHTDLLNYLDTTLPWSKKTDLRERIEQYYACVAYGGDIYDTAAMPKNFSSEWILSQMVPPERLSTKRTFLSG